MAINYAAYRRVSTDEQSESGNGLDTQEVRIKGVSKTHDLHISRWFTDDISGTTPIDKRPDGAKLLKAIKSGQIQGVIVSKVNRLSRDFADCLTLIRDLTRQGVKIYSADVGLIESEENIPMIFQAWTGHTERKTIVEQTTEGRKRKAEKKKFVGAGGTRGTPYGYKRMGSGRDVYLIIDEVQAKIVREIYTRYNSGEGTRAIAESLNARHIQPPRSKRWAKINVIHILSNPIYKGVVSYSGISFTDDKLRIVTPQEWRQAEQNRERRKAHRPKNSDFLLNEGRLRCPVCDGAMIGTSSRQGARTYSYYQCWKRSEYSVQDARRCASKPIRAYDIETTGLAWLAILSVSHDKLKTLIEDMQSRADAEIEPVRGRRQSLVEMIDKTSRKITRTTRLMSDADSDEIAQSFEMDLQRLNELALGLKAQLSECDEELSNYGIWATGRVTAESVQAELQDVWQFARVPRGMEIDYSKIDRAKARAVISKYDLRMKLLSDGQARISCAFGTEVVEIENEGVSTFLVTQDSLQYFSDMHGLSYSSEHTSKLVLSEIVPILPPG